MKVFKTIVITLIALLLVFIILAGIKKQMNVGTTGSDLSESYDERSSEPEEDLYRKRLKQAEGTVKVLGLSLYGEGSHRLEKDDQLVMLLSSDQVSLKDFEGQEVQVRGYIRDTVEGGQKIMDVIAVTPVKESGMKYFSEVGYEFSFSYPAEWDVKKEQNKVTFSESGEAGDTIILIVYQYPGVKESLESWLKDRDQNLFFDESRLTIGQKSGIRRIIKNGDEEVIKSYVKSGTTLYEIRLLSQDEVMKHQYYALLDFFKTSFAEEEGGVISEPIKEVIVDEELKAEEEATLPTEGSPESVPEEVSTTAPGYRLTPLASDQVAKILEKGFLRFDGKSLQFDYPKVWYFAYLGSGKYGFTDEKSYRSNHDEVTEDVSRVLIGGDITGCAVKKETEGYTVCAFESGLEAIIEHMAESLRKS